ncbi:hypothetical protein [Nocardia xishanensis]|uniref:hypothetical protein n=1 Tax=Nocardia xishanensis TaxID=238964 RepID=UPI001FDF6859|nr:hypothetical protein [Nocardia xishanensis]
MTQPVVEVQAIEDTEAVGECEDVLGEQISVSIDDAPFGDPIVEQLDAAVYVPHREVVDPIRQDGRDPARWFLSKRAQQRLPPVAQRSRGARPVDIGAAACQAMETDEQLDQRCQLLPVRGDVGEDVRQSAVLGHAAHDENRFGGPSLRVAQVRDAQIDIGRHPPVELEFASAGLFS